MIRKLPPPSSRKGSKTAKHMEPESKLEKLSGNLLTQSVLTGIAAYVGTPLAALLPVLADSLAAGRYTKRVENALRQISERLEANPERVRTLSDNQFKFVNEVILAVLQTTEEEKLEYLKKALANGLDPNADLVYAAQLSRILRDISAAELRFLTDNFSYLRIIFDHDPEIDRELRVNSQSVEGSLVSGLLALGLVIPLSPSWSDMGRYQFSPLVAKLIAIVKS